MSYYDYTGVCEKIVPLKKYVSWQRGRLVLRLIIKEVFSPLTLWLEHKWIIIYTKKKKKKQLNPSCLDLTLIHSPSDLFQPFPSWSFPLPVGSANNSLPGAIG